MGVLSWLFGATPSRPIWGVSENGNPTLVYGDYRVTVFPQDRGWKYCVADELDRVDPIFSERYKTEEEAKVAALADLGL